MVLCAGNRRGRAEIGFGDVSGLGVVWIWGGGELTDEARSAREMVCCARVMVAGCRLR